MSFAHPPSFRISLLTVALTAQAALLLALAPPAEAQSVSVLGTAGNDVIRLGYNSGTGHHWHRVNAGPFVDDGTTVSYYSVVGYAGDDIIDARGITVVAPQSIIVPLIAQGGPGDDRIWNGDGPSLLLGQEDDDYLRGADSTDVIQGGDGDDRIWGRRGRDTLTGGAGKDIIHGGGDDDRPISGDGGNDIIFGGRGADLVRGANGDDHVRGNSGIDIVLGGAGDDIVFGGRHKDEVDGEGESDQVYGNGGSDVVLGGDGNRDRCVGGSRRDRRVDGGPGLWDICTECPPDNCIVPGCEIQLPYRLPAIFAADPVRAVFDPGTLILALEADSIDVITDGGHLVQHVFDEGPCRDALLGGDLVLGDAVFTGQVGDLFTFEDVDFAIFSPDQVELVSGLITGVILDPATGEFGGNLESTILGDLTGSRMLELLDLAVGAGDSILCTFLNPGAVFELVASTGGFTMPGEATGAYDMVFPNRGPDGLNLEDCTNGIDDNGNGCVDCEDSDCFGSSSCVELACTNGIDDDGDGLTDCADEDCFDEELDCFENCADGEDNNGNGLVDCEDPGCQTDQGCVEYFNCQDGIDNDEDGLVDCEDPECRTEGRCAADAATSSICLVACPQADYPSMVEVLTALGEPLANTIVTLDLAVPVQGGELFFTGLFPPDNTLSEVTDAGAVATFELPIAGATDAGVRVLIEGDSGTIELYASVPLAGFDLNGDHVVDETDRDVFDGLMGSGAPRADYNCDGVVDETDRDIAFGDNGHLGHQWIGVHEVPPAGGRAIVSVIPNPFQTGTTVSYRMDRSGPMRIQVFDVSGRLITTLVDRSDAPAVGSVDWNGRNADGTLVSPGVYFLHVQAPGVAEVRKLVISDR